MKRIVALLVIVCFLGGSLGCAKINLDARGQDNVLSMTKNANKPYTVIKHFKVRDRAYFWVFSLITSKEPEVQALIAKEVKAAGGDGAINVKVFGEYDPLDAIVSFLVGWIFAMRSYEVEGDIIKY